MLNPALSYLGLYFDLADDLRYSSILYSHSRLVLMFSCFFRTSYARFFLSLIAPGGKETDQFRRQFAKKFAHVDDEDYPIFQAVITGRVSLDDPEALAGAGQDSGSGFSLLDMPPPDKAEMHHMRQATAEEGVVEQILRLLRTMPRRLLMILKLNDLTRSLDAALQTVSIFAISMSTSKIADLDTASIRLMDLQCGSSLPTIAPGQLGSTTVLD